MDKPRKLTYNELLDGMSPFLHFREIERAIYEERLERIVLAESGVTFPNVEVGNSRDIESILRVSNTKEYKKRLQLILATTQGSLEALDRVCMVLCPDQKSWAQRRSSIDATQQIAKFLIKPSNHEGIPWYTSERFKLPEDWLNRIRENLVAEIHNSLQSLYSTRIGFALESSIGEIVINSGYTWEKGCVEIVDDKEVDVVVPQLDLPRMLIMSSYNLTTASSQTSRAREQKSMFEAIHRYNSARSRANMADIQLINVVDGGGWLRRSNDLNEMHRNCDYALAYNHLDSKLPEILHYFMKPQVN